MTYRARTINKPTKRLHKRLLSGTIITALLLPMFGPSLAAALDGPSTGTTLPGLIINQIQTGGCTTTAPCVEDTKMEFVELYNTQNLPLQLSGWKVRYISASGATPTELTDLTGQVAAHGYVLIAHAGYYPTADVFYGTPASAGILAKTGGHVEILNSSATSVDKVGWGSASQAQTKPTATIAPGQSAARGTNSDGSPMYSGNNFNDFGIQAAPLPQSGGLSAVSTEPVAEPIPTTPNTIPAETTNPPASVPQTPSSCEGIVISELLPNPAGTDSGHEYIELYNPTNEAISLNGCGLQSSASTTKVYHFGLISLQAGEFRSFNDTETTISLPNSAGGTVWLLDVANGELQEITYPADMDDTVAWALADNLWQATYTPTPGAVNLATPLKPCDDATQVRNPETGRCADAVDPATVVTAAISRAAATTSPTACKASQERNPATNRCRNIVSASAATASACKAGQERNPETNRCKNIAATTTAAKACPAGQERNAGTNRCRKITAAGSSNGSGLDGVKDVASATASKSKPYWLIAAGVIAAAIAYGVYEWRQEIRLFVSRRLGKFGQADQLTIASTRPT